ncbi:Protein OS-9 [Schistosoma japonicum]|nr:Protein OS-9 [Schistosoma japonicum]
MYNKLRNNRRRHKLNSLRRSTGAFLRSLERLSALYKKQSLKPLWSFYSGSSLHSINEDFYFWFHASPLGVDLLKFTSILLERNVVSRCPIPLDTVRIAIIVTKSIVWEVENYIKLFNKSLTPDQAVGMMQVFNLSDIHQSVLRIWHKLFSCTEVSHNVEKQLKQTFSDSLANSDIKVLVIQGHDTIMKDKVHGVASSQGASDSLPYLQRQEIIQIMQKVVTNLDPEISEELDIIEKSENQLGLSTYYIMPGGSKKKEEKRIRKLEQNYGFTFR